MARKPAPAAKATPPRKSAIVMAQSPKEIAKRKAREAATAIVDDSPVVDKHKKYVEHMMSLNKGRSTTERCIVYIDKVVNRVKAEEWARYWQPRFGAPLKLMVVEKQQDGHWKIIDRLPINNGEMDDPFPARAINYPWQSEDAEHLAANTQTWAHDATVKPTKPETDADDVAPVVQRRVPQAVPTTPAPIVQRRVAPTAAPPTLPRRVAPSPATEGASKYPGVEVTRPAAPARKAASAPTTKPKPAAAKSNGNGSTRDVIVRACSKKGGATSAELFAVTGYKTASWSHQLKVSAGLTGLRAVINKVDGVTRYALV